jgi:ATP-dependent exoDNAse (exonuclease V) beta subunit
VTPPTLEGAMQGENREKRDENLRLLYVACTRAMELLVIPDFTWCDEKSWAKQLDFRLDDIPELDVSKLGRTTVAPPKSSGNRQSAEVFTEEQSRIAAVLREAKIDRKTLQRDYHAESYARVLSFVASTSTRAHVTARREPKTTGYYRAMRSYAAAAEGAKLEVTRLTKLLDEARSEISRLTQARASSSKVNKARKEAA